MIQHVFIEHNKESLTHQYLFNAIKHARDKTL